MRVEYSKQFLRAFKKLPNAVQNQYRKKERVFFKDHFDPQLKTHKLQNSQYYSFSVTYKIRVIFFIDVETIVLANIGDHSLYKKL